MARPYDVCIVGAGILGLATARAWLERAPRTRIVILEKERAIAQHQTGHNSGVLHQGVYYKPNSLKAKLSIDGARRMAEYCQQHALPYQRVGKVIVAVTHQELARLEIVYERARANGVPHVTKIERDALNEIEPRAAGIQAIYSPDTAIVDYRRVAEKMRDEIELQGAELELDARVTQILTRREIQIVSTPRREFHAHMLINCAGLYADSLARLAGAATDVHIVPFRGEYYFLKPERAALVRGLIYPVSDPQLPFLGVHFTRTIHGSVEAGPNAVFALAREGYAWKKINARETIETVFARGFGGLTRRWWRTGIFEFYRSLSKRAFVQSLQKLVPEIRADDITRGGAGVRAQAVNARGELLDDFCFVESPRALHVLNAPSPAATASLAIGAYIAARAEKMLA